MAAKTVVHLDKITADSLAELMADRRDDLKVAMKVE